MLVCQCHRVSDATVDTVLSAGATTLRGIAKATHAGTGCGGCLPQLRAMCQEAAARRACALHDDEALAG